MDARTRYAQCRGWVNWPSDVPDTLTDVTGYLLPSRSSCVKPTPDYIHRYINGHGRLRTSSDPNRRMRPHPGLPVGGD
jgi:hypothetical protein